MNPSTPLPRPGGPPADPPARGLRLDAGAHLVPGDGACLMEYVSVLAGDRFGDRPRCTDPVLATLARLVNDACSDTARPLLAGFGPALAESGRGDARRTADLVRTALRTACAAAGGRRARRHLAHAERRYRRVTGAGPVAALARRLDPLYRSGSGRRHLEAAVERLCTLPGARRDAALIATLSATIAAASPAPRPALRPRPAALPG